MWSGALRDETGLQGVVVGSAADSAVRPKTATAVAGSCLVPVMTGCAVEA